MARKQNTGTLAPSTVTVADSVAPEDMARLARLADVLPSDGQDVTRFAVALDVDSLAPIREALADRLSEALAAPVTKRREAVGTVAQDLRSVFVAAEEVTNLAEKVEAMRAYLAEWRADVVSAMYDSIARRGQRGPLSQAWLAEVLNITPGRMSQLVTAETDRRATEAEKAEKARQKAEKKAAEKAAEKGATDVDAADVTAGPVQRGPVKVEALADIVADVLDSLPTAVILDSPEDREALADILAPLRVWMDSLSA